MSLWAVTFLEYWKRTNSILAHRWDCSEFEDIEVMAQYRMVLDAGLWICIVCCYFPMLLGTFLTLGEAKARIYSTCTKDHSQSCDRGRGAPLS